MLKGSLVALVTPFNSDNSVNYEELEKLLEYHMNNETDGIVILGTTAEATTLSHEESCKIVEFSVKKVNKKIPVIVGAGSNDTLKAVKLAKDFSKLGADYLLVITPYYNKTNEKGLIKHFEMIAEASSCPLILYNVPSRTGMSISLKAIEVLSKNKNIYGIKEASGNMSYAMEVAKHVNDDFVMYSGNDDIIVPMMAAGAMGVISVLANICPNQVHKMCELCINNDFNAARKIQHDFLDVANSLFYETNPIPVKAALNYLGFNVGGYRMPLYDMSPDNFKRMTSVIDSKKGVIM